MPEHSAAGRLALDCKADLAVDDAGAITATAWIFSRPDRAGDVIEARAFASATPPIPMLAAHDQGEPIGAWHTVRVEGDRLRVEGRLLVDDVAKARETRALILAGGLGGVSIGFWPTAATPRRGGGRNISALDLAEISIVAVPAHDGARISSIKTAAAAAKPEGAMPELDDGAAPDLAAIETRLSAIETKAADLAKISDRLAAVEVKANRPGTVETKDAPSEERKSFGTYLRHGTNAPDLDRKALRASSDPGGGYLAPPEMSAEMIREITEFSPIRSIASVRGSAAGSVVYPKRTAITNAAWRGENQAQTESDPTFGQVEIVAKEVTTFVDISNILLQDAGVDVEAEVRLALSEDFGKKEATAFVNGDGVLAPLGFMSASGVAYTANGHASNMSGDALISLMYAIPAAYRQRGTWVMNGATLATVRKLKDGQSNYLWQPSYQLGQPETLLGRPVVEAVDMPEATSDLYPIAFGDFNSAYRIVDRVGLSILANPYIRATEGFTRYHATRRVGGAVIQASAIRKLKMAVS